MSANRLVTIFCDGCSVWWDTGVGDTATEPRKRLKKLGWTRDYPNGTAGGQDLCPDCTRERAT